jgi:hypothetical protein
VSAIERRQLQRFRRIGRHTLLRRARRGRVAPQKFSSFPQAGVDGLRRAGTGATPPARVDGLAGAATGCRFPRKGTRRKIEMAEAVAADRFIISSISPGALLRERTPFGVRAGPKRAALMLFRR